MCCQKRSIFSLHSPCTSSSLMFIVLRIIQMREARLEAKQLVTQVTNRKPPRTRMNFLVLIVVALFILFHMFSRSLVALSILFVFSVSVSAAGLYSPSSNVIQLTKENFVAEVFDSPHIWMVEFYAPWCTCNKC
mgnify:CR=1 FL=1